MYSNYLFYINYKIDINVYKNTLGLYNQIFQKFKLTKTEIFDSLLNVIQQLFLNKNLTLDEIFENNSDIYKDIINMFFEVNKFYIQHTVKITLLDLVFLCDHLNKKIPYINEFYDYAINNENKDFLIELLAFGNPSANFDIFLSNHSDKNIIMLEQCEKFNFNSENNSWMFSEDLKINAHTQLTNIFDFNYVEENGKKYLTLKDMILDNSEISKYDIVENIEYEKILNITNFNNYYNELSALIEETI